MNERYIGDGVYASFDGYFINLAVNHHTNHVIALEPEVVSALKEYFKEIESLTIIDNTRNITEL